MKRLDPPVDLGPDLAFLRELWALDHALQKCSKRMVRDLGITGAQRLALRLVSRFPGLPLGKLARLLQLHPSTVTGVAKRLVSRGLLARRSDGPDRRRSFLQITPAGLELLGASQPTIESAVLEALRSMNPHEVQTAIRSLAAVSSGLSRTLTSGPPEGD